MANKVTDKYATMRADLEGKNAAEVETIYRRLFGTALSDEKIERMDGPRMRAGIVTFAKYIDGKRASDPTYRPSAEEARDVLFPRKKAAGKSDARARHATARQSAIDNLVSTGFADSPDEAAAAVTYFSVGADSDGSATGNPRKIYGQKPDTKDAKFSVRPAASVVGNQEDKKNEAVDVTLFGVVWKYIKDHW